MGNATTNQDQASDEIDDIELLPLEDSQSVMRPIGGSSAVQRSSTLPPARPDGRRSSSPPPIPPAARLSRPPPPPQSGMPSLPLPPPPAGRAFSTSGVYPRLSQTPLPPPLSPVAIPDLGPQASAHDSVTQPPPSARQSQLEVARLRDGLVRTQAEYRALKNTLRERDDLIAELQQALHAQRQLVLDAECQRDALQRQVNTPREDLKRIRGIGPAFEQKLQAVGVTSYAQIAAWTASDIERIAGDLGILPARIARDGWIARAGELAR